MIVRSYSELSRLTSFEERYQYLQLRGEVGKETFGFDRYLNQLFYKLGEWLTVRDKVIIRDNGCDLGIKGREIYSGIIIHHMNVITKEDILSRSKFLLNPEYLICTFDSTHKAIHYSNESLLIRAPVDRAKNDTCPWKQN